jgi:hypothetical protein
MQLKNEIMITQYEANSLLKEEFPQLAGKIYPSKISLEVYASMNYFSDYTRHAVEEHNFNLAKKCFVLAEKLYREGDRIVRLLIENIFVYSFSNYLPGTKIERAIVRSMIPAALYSLYTRQVMQPGC